MLFSLSQAEQGGVATGSSGTYPYGWEPVGRLDLIRPSLSSPAWPRPVLLIQGWSGLVEEFYQATVSNGLVPEHN
jgi:hypothetical protein